MDSKDVRKKVQDLVNKMRLIRDIHKTFGISEDKMKEYISKVKGAISLDCDDELIRRIIISNFNPLDGIEFRLASGISLFMGFEEKIDRFYLQLNNLFGTEEKSKDPWLAINLETISDGQPVLSLNFREDEANCIDLCSGEPVWKIIESLLEYIPTDFPVGRF